MDTETLQSTVEGAIANKRWMTIMLHGCGSITIRPALIEMSLGVQAMIAGDIAPMLEHTNATPPTSREQQDGHAMRQRIQQATSPQSRFRTISLTLDSSDVKAILVYDQ